MDSALHLKKLDSFEFEARFSNEHGIRYNEIKSGEIRFEDIKPFLSKLPRREADLVDLYYRLEKNQKDIARMYGITQGAVSSRLARARKRLNFLRDIPKISDEDIDNKLGQFFEDLELEIIKTMKHTTCQSKTAKIINERHGWSDEKKRMTQVKVRHRFEKCIIFLKAKMAEDPSLSEYHRLLVFIKKNLYKLHEVLLPHFNRGRYAVYSYNN